MVIALSAPDGADAPVWRAWIELARGSGRADLALDAARQLGPGQLDVGERLALRAWLHEQQGDTQAELSTLEQWLRLEPTAARALERLAELAQRAGQSERVADLRCSKAEVERALEAYRLLLWRDEPLRDTAERYELAPPGGGRRSPVRGPRVVSLGPRSRSGPHPGARGPGPTRSGRRRAAAGPQLATIEPWPSAGGHAAPRSPATSRPSLFGRLAFTDDAEAAGLRFVYDNAETAQHQLPESFGGGLALLDYDGDGWLDVYCVQGGPFVQPSSIGSTSPDLG